MPGATGRQAYIKTHVLKAFDGIDTLLDAAQLLATTRSAGHKNPPMSAPFRHELEAIRKRVQTSQAKLKGMDR